ncbi:hypothetical protein AJ79_02775 [Helicocarpus griseus UAMH5409]|uniref:BTB domain-containing protein n=1 Tax=Helicocarpus griseus UAMH5409 TaxID=1447875 RepID=A0A2B7Y229_9EURO|nr:hypothetical protein AJ79_02775 [Helicocarpus griseus UAMH5409]
MSDDNAIPAPDPRFIRRYGEAAYATRPRVSDNQQLPLTTDDRSFEEWLAKLRHTETPRYSMPTPSPFAHVHAHNLLAMLSGATEMVDVVVGDDHELVWRLHEALLSDASPFFKAAMEGPFQEAADRKVHLAEESNDVFALFVQWLYARSFTSYSMDILLRAYVLGDRLGTHEFRTATVDKIHEAARWHKFSIEQLIFVTEHTLPNSALRTLVIDSVALKILVGQWPVQEGEDWDALDFLHAEILQAIAQFCYDQSFVNQAMTIDLPQRGAYIDSD